MRALFPPCQLSCQQGPSRAQQQTLLLLALRKSMKEDHKFKVSLAYTEFSPACKRETLFLRKRERRREGKKEGRGGEGEKDGKRVCVSVLIFM